MKWPRDVETVEEAEEGEGGEGEAVEDAERGGRERERANHRHTQEGLGWSEVVQECRGSRRNRRRRRW